MFFQPTGDLREDYGAFCETAVLGERVDVYGGILTNIAENQVKSKLASELVNRRQVMLAQLQASEEKLMEWFMSMQDLVQQCAAIRAEESLSDGASGKHPVNSKNQGRISSRPSSSDVAGKRKGNAATTGKGANPTSPSAAAATAAAGGGKAGGADKNTSLSADPRAAGGDAAAAAAPVMTVEMIKMAAQQFTHRAPTVKRELETAIAAVDELRYMCDQLKTEEETFKEPQKLTVLRLRYPAYCLNQRDISPLCRAIPHCWTLVSVELTGCGLSEDSYLRLVGALYESPHVQQLRVDFNGGAASTRGFFADPTIVSSQKRQQDFPIQSVSVPAPSFVTMDREDDHSISSPIMMKRSSTVVSSPVSQVPTSQNRPSTGARRGLNQRVEIFVTPTHYRSLHLQVDIAALEAAEAEGGAGAAATHPPSASPGSASAKGKKDEKGGKVDPKKPVVEPKMFREEIDELDKRLIAVPRGWHGAIMTPIKELSLRCNAITDAQVSLLCSALSSHPRSELQTLSLWGNKITDIGAKSIADMLRVNRTLKWLNVGANAIGDAGVVALLEPFLTMDVTQQEAVAYRQQFFTSIHSSITAGAAAGGAGDVVAVQVAPPVGGPASPPRASIQSSAFAGGRGAGSPAGAAGEQTAEDGNPLDALFGNDVVPSLLLGNWTADDKGLIAAAAVDPVAPQFPTYTDWLVAWAQQMGVGTEDVVKKDGKRAAGNTASSGGGAGGGGGGGQSGGGGSNNSSNVNANSSNNPNAKSKKSEDKMIDRYRLPFDRDCVRVLGTFASNAPISNYVIGRGAGGTARGLVGAGAGGISAAATSTDAAAVHMSLPSTSVSSTNAAMRIPGNFALCGLYLGENTKITPAGAAAALRLLQRGEPLVDQFTSTCGSLPKLLASLGWGGGGDGGTADGNNNNTNNNNGVSNSDGATDSNSAANSYNRLLSIVVEDPKPYCAVNSLRLTNVILHHQKLSPHFQEDINRTLAEWRTAEMKALSSIAATVPNMSA